MALLVSIHAPREGCDYLLAVCHLLLSACFNSRTPGGVRHCRAHIYVSEEKFQFTHPGRGATKRELAARKRLMFQFTHPGRGATVGLPIVGYRYGVSIHAPREGCDCVSEVKPEEVKPVSIHAPREGCDLVRIFAVPASVVSIHAPREGCDKVIVYLLVGEQTVSIHAPREGCDINWSVLSVPSKRFNSRTPGGVRPQGRDIPYQGYRVSIHAPREGCD